MTVIVILFFGNKNDGQRHCEPRHHHHWCAHCCSRLSQIMFQLSLFVSSTNSAQWHRFRCQLDLNWTDGDQIRSILNLDHIGWDFLQFLFHPILTLRMSSSLTARQVSHQARHPPRQVSHQPPPASHLVFPAPLPPLLPLQQPRHLIADGESSSIANFATLNRV